MLYIMFLIIIGLLIESINAKFSLWSILGLSLVSMCINVIQLKLEKLFEVIVFLNQMKGKSI